MVPILPTWREPDALLQELHFVIMARPGWTFDWASLPPPFRRLEQNVVPAPLVEISSTMIRRRRAAGQSVRYLTPPAVEHYLDHHGLYRDTPATPPG
jgi:nicotinate-nucleotide adenylyltransferase